MECESQDASGFMGTNPRIPSEPQPDERLGRFRPSCLPACPSFGQRRRPAARAIGKPLATRQDLFPRCHSSQFPIAIWPPSRSCSGGSKHRADPKAETRWVTFALPGSANRDSQVIRDWLACRPNQLDPVQRVHPLHNSERIAFPSKLRNATSAANRGCALPSTTEWVSNRRMQRLPNSA